MVITVSDYLLEQEISTASCSDIVLEQAAAEIEVYGKLFDAYVKQAIMFEYASYTESDEESSNTDEKSEEKKEGIFKKIGKAVKGFFAGIWEFLKGLWDKIVNFFSKTKVDHMVKKMDEMSDEEKKEFSGAIAPALGENKGSGSLRKKLFKDITDLTAKFVELFDSLTTNLDTWNSLASEAESVRTKMVEFRKFREGQLKSNDMSMSRVNHNNWAEYRAWLIDIKNVCEDTTISEMLKSLKKKETADKFAEAVGYKGEKGEDKSKFDALMKCIKQTGNIVTNESGKAANEIMKMVEAGRNAMIARRKKEANEAKKLEKEAKKAARKAANEEDTEDED